MRILLLLHWIAALPLMTGAGRVTAQAGLAEIEQNAIPGSYGIALRQIDSFLQIHPDSIDALILKANILYGQYQDDEPEIYLEANIDESIFESSIGFLGDYKLVIDSPSAMKIVAPMYRVLELDSSRMDVLQGISYIYSVSLMDWSLRQMLPRMAALLPEEPESAYNLAAYASYFNDREDFEGTVRIYETVVGLYPDYGDILSDMGALYFMHGDLASARKYIDSSLALPVVDAMSWNNAFFLYGIMEDYDRAQDAIDKAAELEGTSENLFYKALLALAEDKPWRNLMQEYLGGNAAQEETVSAVNLLLSGSLVDTSLYTSLMDLELTENYRLLFDRIFMRTTSYFLPAFNYAEALSYHYRYEDAIKAFRSMDTSILSPAWKDAWLANLGWALYKSGRWDEMLEAFAPLLDSEDLYYQSAAVYFTGKYYLDKGDENKARSYFMQMEGSESKSKYANLCHSALVRMQ